ncbi:MAG: type II toxin-antitoxin system toxin DNA ADP-ribosyl transferase DarT [Pseudomonadota bacterium]
MPVPEHPKIYHIVHVDRLPSIIAEGTLLCDAEIARRANANPANDMGTTIGMNSIKQRRLSELTLMSHPDLYVGQCVPFYFCPRSIMLFLIFCANHRELAYRDGQAPIVHLEADLKATVDWANSNGFRWAFTLSNAGAYYFEDRADLSQLDKIDWEAVETKRWSGHGIPMSVKESKQAEFLLEQSFPWHLVTRIGVNSRQVYGQVREVLSEAHHKPHVEIRPDWYY